MRTQATAWAASLALASLCGPLLITAEAAPAPQITPLQKPKYYFPRHVKRQFFNTTTPVIIVGPPDTATSDPESDLSSIFSSLQSEGASIFTGDPTGPIPPIVIPPTTTTTTDDSNSTPPPTTTDDSSSASETGITVGLTTAFGPTTTADPGLPDLSSLFSSLASDLSDLFPTPPTTTSSDPPTTTPAPTTTTTSDPGNVLSSILSDVSSLISDIVPTTTDPGNPLSSIISSVESGVSSIVSSVASDFSTPTTDIPPPTSSSTVISLPTSLLPTTTGTGIFPSSTGTGTGPLGTGGTVTSTGTGVSVSTPTLTGTGGVGGNGTTAVVPPTSTGTVVSTGSGTASGSGASSTPGASLIPTGTNTLTAEVIPSSVLVEPSTVSPSMATGTATGLPADIPKVIQPPDGMPTNAPPNTTLVQFGFTFGLNYPFVAKTKDSANQIFQFLPQGVSYGLTIPGDQVTMYALRPYDTTATLGYITTLALFFIPSNMFDQLNLDKNTPVSSLYQNPDASVNTLMSLVNPSIPLLAGSLPADGNSPTDSDSPGASSTVGPGGDGPMGNGATTNSPIVASSVGIAFAAAGGALAYGAAMFFIARRYRKKRQGHVRSSSVATTSRGSRGSYGAVWMSGARGPGRGSPGERTSQGSGSTNSRSIRTAQISAPVMAENSLGWN